MVNLARFTALQFAIGRSMNPTNYSSTSMKKQHDFPRAVVRRIWAGDQQQRQFRHLEKRVPGCARP
jgi:hypothetical protein